MTEEVEDNLTDERKIETNLLTNYRPIGIKAVLSACLAQKRA